MDRYFPDKAIDVIDEASSRRKLQGDKYPADVVKLQTRLQEVTTQKDQAVWSQNFQEAANLREKERNLRRMLEAVKKLWQVKQEKDLPTVSEDDIAHVVSKWTGIPLTKIEENETVKLLHMEEELHRRVVGQEEAIKAVSRAIRRSRTGIKNAKRPAGAFILLGPTGVGKTELSRALAEYLT